MNDYFEITSISRADVERVFGNRYASLFTDDDMKRLANAMRDDYLEQTYWAQIKLLAPEIVKR